MTQLSSNSDERLPAAQLQSKLQIIAEIVKKSSGQLKESALIADTYLYNLSDASLERGAAFPEEKPIDCLYSAIVHGNEVVGVDVFIRLMRAIVDKTWQPKISMAFFLGNIDSYKQGKRFLTRNFNRLFTKDFAEILAKNSNNSVAKEDSKSATAGSQVNCPEQLRAALASKYLMANCRYMLDMHQTIQPARQAFFIFPYQRSNYLFARSLDPQLALVTHWGGKFSNEGMSSDEYVIACGGTGISVELGQYGFIEESSSLGEALCRTAARAIEGNAMLKDLPHTDKNLYTDATIHKIAKGDRFHLDKNLANFSPIKMGSSLGQVNGKDLLAKSDGYALFPYLPSPVTAGLPPPTEICREITEIDVGVFPQE